jgi:monofunctional glycosyltransferase
MHRILRLLGLGVGGFLLWLLAAWPPPVWYRTHWPRRTAFMSRSLPPAPSRGKGKPPAPPRPTPLSYRPVPLDSIAPFLQEAAIIGEDNNFFSHGGIDYLALAHALGYRRPVLDWSDPADRKELLAVLPQAWNRRDRLRGASTISQQLAKNLYLSPSRNPLRKLKEAVITWRLEAALGKRRIMELYLNVVELGKGIFGAEAASREYFGRGAFQLTREQAAALAGSLPFPLRSNPGYRPGRMRWRQDLILRRMRGEQVEVPKEEADEGANPTAADSATDSTALPTADSILPPPPAESLPPDTVPFPPPPADSVPLTPKPGGDTTAPPAPSDSAPPPGDSAGVR